MVSPRMRLLRGLAGRVLSCGCLVGVYETYNSGVVATIDARGPLCEHNDHRLHGLVDLHQAGVPKIETLQSMSARH